MTQASFIKIDERTYESTVKAATSGAGYVPIPVSLKGKRVKVIVLDS